MIPSSKQIRERFPDWDERERAAYRRGVAWFDAGAEIGSTEGVHPCTLRGYADAMGDDAEYTDWWTMIEEDWAISERWWE